MCTDCMLTPGLRDHGAGAGEAGPRMIDAGSLDA